MKDIWVPASFRGDGLHSHSLLSHTVCEIGDFSVIQGSDAYIRVFLEDMGVSLAKVFFVVRPSLWVYAMRYDNAVWVTQDQGRPVVRADNNMDASISYAERVNRSPQYVTPLLAFGGWEGTQWLRFVFRSNPHSLSDYGWISEVVKENPLTPEWASVILSHGQEIAHA